MQLTTDAIVIGQKSIKENDRLITLLTREHGVIRAFANRARQVSGRLSTATQLLAFSDFVIYKGKSTYTVNSADVKKIFHKLFSDLNNLSLAQYFCELMTSLCPSEENTNEYLRLMLNSLHLLGEGKKNPMIIKAVFELRMMTLIGYMPNLVGCDKCGSYGGENMIFLYQSGHILCDSCEFSRNEPFYTLPLRVMTSMRHICYSDFDKIFSFSLPDENAVMLKNASESYLLSKIDRGFNTLDFYNGIIK